MKNQSNDLSLIRSATVPYYFCYRWCVVLQKKEQFEPLIAWRSIKLRKKEEVVSSRLTLYHDATANQVKESVRLKSFKLQFSFLREFSLY